MWGSLLKSLICGSILLTLFSICMGVEILGKFEEEVVRFHTLDCQTATRQDRMQTYPFLFKYNLTVNSSFFALL